MRGKSPGGCPPVFDAQRVPVGGRQRRPLRLGVVEGCFLFVLDSESGRDGIFDRRFYLGSSGVGFSAPTSGAAHGCSLVSPHRAPCFLTRCPSTGTGSATDS